MYEDRQRFAPLTPIHFNSHVKSFIFTDNVNKALFELCDEVTVGWCSMRTCIIVFHTDVKHVPFQ